MTPPEEQPGEKCKGPCDKCKLAGALESAAERQGIAGWRMVLASTLVFLLPLVLAIAGAALTRQAGETRQLIGAAAGLAAGVAVAVPLMRLIRPKPEEK